MLLLSQLQSWLAACPPHCNAMHTVARLAKCNFPSSKEKGVTGASSLPPSLKAAWEAGSILTAVFSPFKTAAVL